MWKTLAFAATLTLASSPVFAADWYLAATNQSGTTFEIDRETVTREGDTVIFWVKVHYGPKVVLVEADSYVARRRANCSDLSYNDIQTNYTRQGKLTSSSGEEEKHFAPPDSVAAAVIKSVCAG
jgi:hypothetical protein